MSALLPLTLPRKDQKIHKVEIMPKCGIFYEVRKKQADHHEQSNHRNAKGIIHYSKKGAHIVPSNPDGY